MGVSLRFFLKRTYMDLADSKGKRKIVVPESLDDNVRNIIILYNNIIFIHFISVSTGVIFTNMIYILLNNGR